MFEDEKPDHPLVDPEEFQTLAIHFAENRGRPWTAQEAEGVYNHLEQLLFEVSMFEMALEGYVTIFFDGNEILYQGTVKGERLADNHQKIKDNKAVEDLMRDL